VHGSRVFLNRLEVPPGVAKSLAEKLGEGSGRMIFYYKLWGEIDLATAFAYPRRQIVILVPSKTLIIKADLLQNFASVGSKTNSIYIPRICSSAKAGITYSEPTSENRAIQTCRQSVR